MLARREVFQHAEEFIIPKPAHQLDVARLGLSADWRAYAANTSQTCEMPCISPAGAAGTHCLTGANWLLAPVQHLCESQGMRLALVAVRCVPLGCVSFLAAGAAQLVAQRQPSLSDTTQAPDFTGLPV